MTLPIISIGEAIERMNAALKEHPQFQEGMYFTAHPERANGRDVLGLNAVGWHLAPGAFAAAHNAVQAKFDISVA